MFVSSTSFFQLLPKHVQTGGGNKGIRNQTKTDFTIIPGNVSVSESVCVCVCVQQITKSYFEELNNLKDFPIRPVIQTSSTARGAWFRP